jgi:hypothetical protein
MKAVAYKILQNFIHGMDEENDHLLNLYDPAVDNMKVCYLEQIFSLNCTKISVFIMIGLHVITLRCTNGLIACAIHMLHCKIGKVSWAYFSN